VKRVVVAVDRDTGRQYHRAPEEHEEFAIYGLHAAGQLFKKYLPRMLADSF
jgi:hypothetical protein